jgi:SagB-type dehydrogenase family enzyme
LSAPATRKPTGEGTAKLFARVSERVTLDIGPDGKTVARFSGHAVEVVTLEPDAAARAQDLRDGLAFETFASPANYSDTELLRLVRRLAGHGLLEYRLARTRDDADAVVIEPQMPGYWPRLPALEEADMLALSRFAYLRRRADDLVLESPRAGALFRICDPEIAAAIARLVSPQPVGALRHAEGGLDATLLALLVDCRILFPVDPARANDLRSAEGNDDLVLWDFHDLLFHTRSTEGRHANPLGGAYPYAAVMAPLPAVRPAWPGQKIDLAPFAAAASPSNSGLPQLLRKRHSTRNFDADTPITLAELAQFLDATSRIYATFEGKLDELGEESPVISYAIKPYPGAGGAYELELYLAVDKCEGLARGFYHYDAAAHALVAVDVSLPAFEALLTSAEFAMGASAVPQVLFTIAARFGRISWKYSAVAYALILKDVGVLTQTFYLMATEMGLGGCAIGSTNIELFAKMTGLDFCVEGPVGHFALGRPGPEAEGTK